jgi:hypothetical protein
MCPRQELNLDLELRRFSFYPLNYEDINGNSIPYHNNFPYSITITSL